MTINCFLNSTLPRYLLYIMTESKAAKAQTNLRFPRNSGENPKYSVQKQNIVDAGEGALVKRNIKMIGFKIKGCLTKERNNFSYSLVFCSVDAEEQDFSSVSKKALRPRKRGKKAVIKKTVFLQEKALTWLFSQNIKQIASQMGSN